MQFLEQYAEQAKKQIDEVFQQCSQALTEAGVPDNGKTIDECRKYMKQFAEEGRNTAEAMLAFTAEAVSERLKETEPYPCRVSYNTDTLKLTTTSKLFSHEYTPDKDVFHKESVRCSPVVTEAARQCDAALYDAALFTHDNSGTSFDLVEILNGVEIYMEEENIPYEPDELAHACNMFTAAELNDKLEAFFEAGEQDGKPVLLMDGKPYQQGMLTETHEKHDMTME